MKHLARAVNTLHESSMARVDVDAMTFAGDINEAFNSFNLMIAEEMNEAAAESWFSNQLLLETSIENPKMYDELSEGVFGNFFEGVKKFFKSMVAFIKGIVEKIKVQIVSHTGSVTQWEKVVLPKVEKNLTDSKIKDGFTYTGYDWKGLDNLKKMDDQSNIATVATAVDEFKALINTTKDNMKSGIEAKKNWETNAAGNEADRKGQKKTLLSKAGLDVPEDLSADRAKDKIKDAVMKDICKNKKSVEDYLKDEIKDIRSAEKIEIARFNKGASPSAMVDFIKGSKEMLEKVSDRYDELQDKYQNVLNVLSDIDVAVETDGMKNVDNRSHYKGMIEDAKEVIELKKHEISLRQSCMNSVLNKKRALTQEATKEFMVVLGQFANARAPKTA